MQITLVQDWFTNLAWDQPQLFYILPCVYNAQTNIQLLRPPWEEVGSTTIIQLSMGLHNFLLGPPNVFIMLS